MEHFKIKIIEMMQILKTEAGPSRAIFSQVIFWTRRKNSGDRNVVEVISRPKIIFKS